MILIQLIHASNQPIRKFWGRIRLRSRVSQTCMGIRNTRDLIVKQRLLVSTIIASSLVNLGWAWESAFLAGSQGDAGPESELGDQCSSRSNIESLLWKCRNLSPTSDLRNQNLHLIRDPAVWVLIKRLTKGLTFVVWEKIQREEAWGSGNLPGRPAFWSWY